jgi:hypothetical protein
MKENQLLADRAAGGIVKKKLDPIFHFAPCPSVSSLADAARSV